MQAFGDAEVRLTARRESVDDRAAKAIAVTPGDEPFVWWCNLNAEAEAITAGIPGAPLAVAPVSSLAVAALAIAAVPVSSLAVAALAVASLAFASIVPIAITVAASL